MHKLKVLICDDMEHVRIAHEHHLHQCGGTIFQSVVRSAETAEEAVSICKAAAEANAPYDLLLLDVNFGEADRMDGFEAANKIHQASPGTTIVMISAYSTDDNQRIAEESPWVERFLRRGEFSKLELQQECYFALIRRLHQRGELLSGEEVAVTQSPVMLDYLKKADRISSSQNVVIYGETGTGKELTAKRINANARVVSAQSRRPLVSINCGGLPPTLVESELFGYVRGAFTGANQNTPGLLEQADGGDLFLDELQNAPRKLQEVLMRVLNDKQFMPVGGKTPKKLNVRFISALNQSPIEAKKAGTLMPDLLARLQQGYLVIPALRERQGDVPTLIEHFKTLAGPADKTFSKEAVAFLAGLPWPTNVRGLKSVVEQAIRGSKVPVIRPEVLRQLPLVAEILVEASASPSGADPKPSSLETKVQELVETWLTSGLALEGPVVEFEKQVLSTLWAQDPSIARVARRSKLSETALRRKLIKYGIAEVSA